MSLLSTLIVCLAVVHSPTETQSPAEAPSAQPNLTRGADGRLYLSWIETGADQLATLRFSTWNEGAWSAPRTIAAGADWFVNWADFPSLCALADGTLAAHWLQKSGDAPFAYHVRISLSPDGGKTWSAPITPHRDATPTEHGFVSIVPLQPNSFGLFWLDGRHMAHGAGGDMSLRFTTLSSAGRLGDEWVVDERVCECCQTSAVELQDGRSLVVYRDRSATETRDIGFASLDKQGVAKVGMIHKDGWIIEGCPVNGPAVDRHQRTVAVAWFTSADDRPQVHLCFSRDLGATFDGPLLVDDGHPIGRVDVVLVDPDTAAVAWFDHIDGVNQLRWRIVNRDGQRQTSQLLATTRSGRASGFPQLEFFEGHLFFAWTDTSQQPHRIRTFRVPVSP